MIRTFYYYMHINLLSWQQIIPIDYVTKRIDSSGIEITPTTCPHVQSVQTIIFAAVRHHLGYPSVSISQLLSDYHVLLVTVLTSIHQCSSITVTFFYPQVSQAATTSMLTTLMAIAVRMPTLPLRGLFPRPLETSGGWCGSSTRPTLS